MNNLSQFQKRIIIVAVIIAIGFIGYHIYGKDSQKNTNTNEENILAQTEEETVGQSEDEIIIHVTGAVKKEGVVTLSENARIADAVDAAGGLKDDADMSKINLAGILEDGTKVTIPSKKDKKEEETKTEETKKNDDTSKSTENSNTTSKVNINKANQAELEKLPGIGAAIAVKIIKHRDENGKFSKIEDLKKVNGVGDSKFEEIKNLISVK